MNKIVSLSLLLVALGAVSTAFGQQAQLHASTVPEAKVGAVGRLDTTVSEALLFRAPGQPDLSMPYAKITQIARMDDVTHHLGFFPALAVGLFLPRQRRHLISITYTDPKDASQVATFEVGKHDPETIMPVLEGRARNACERHMEFGFCSPLVSQPRKPLTPSKLSFGSRSV